MPGKFKFSLAKPEKFDQAAYLQAIHETRKLQPPADLYVSYGPEDMGVAMVIRAQHRQEWNLVLPTDPNKYDLECGFTYGITSRREIWDFVKPVLLGVCRSSPHAFSLEWEDGDLGDVVEVGRFDPAVGDIVVHHRGLPSMDQFNSMPRPASGSWHSQQR
ncbi:hypothetical protein PLESTB_000985700 [Pleodorina starrii]|uniref:Uncharacterized protein n=1 Tax=Pleodorina starrii TaxID=330485 RepID=A0A9W6F3R7_9CHLO|nr:hypothetical protein PLESTM_000548200 [Pleodorina starrii]GLC55423.1 hypothetical protein PLESTB_000985700 [Pleodorina starrii]GLC73816.1 hypothetical protein PLESTF_001424100 [Pleodorina starrii]